MNFTLENENLVIFLEGYLRSDNAEAVKKEILSIIAEHPDNRVIFDATNLVYVASSGLRVLLTVQKMTNRIGFPDNECSILETRLQVKIDSRASRKE